jgi:hypothetical protein
MKILEAVCVFGFIGAIITAECIPLCLCCFSAAFVAGAILAKGEF